MKLNKVFLYFLIALVMASCSDDDSDEVQPVEVTIVNPPDEVKKEEGFRIDKLSIEFPGVEWENNRNVRGQIVNSNNTNQFYFSQSISNTGPYPKVSTQFGLLDDSEWRVYTYSNQGIDGPLSFVRIIDPKDFVRADGTFEIKIEQTAPLSERIEYTISGKVAEL
jgi:hypothetical protein